MTVDSVEPLFQRRVKWPREFFLRYSPTETKNKRKAAE